MMVEGNCQGHTFASGIGDIMGVVHYYFKMDKHWDKTKHLGSKLVIC